MRAVRTRYVVDGWGEGELWTDGGVLLAHDFEFGPIAADGGAHEAEREGVGAGACPGGPLGGASPPSGTVATNRAQVVDGFVTREHQVADPGFDAGSDGGIDPGLLAERVRSFLGGQEVSLADVPLDLSGTTPFQRDVVEALRSVSWGEVVSYGELAALAGYPRAGRAVGSVCATNRFMLFVPCHRVVASDGIGGYGSAGVGVKRRLLALEGVSL